MKSSHRSWWTIGYGILCGAAFAPLSLALAYFWPWAQAFGLTVWACGAGYALLLAVWSRRGARVVIFPLLVMLAAVFTSGSRLGLIVMALTILAWVRSGVCFSGAGLKKLALELALSGGAVLILVLLPPRGLTGLALGAWTFFLVQSMYFVLDPGAEEERSLETDPFDRACRRAERILTETT
ncbi:MAG: hypothetical protein AB1641_28725 [Thermodesulfobacteriota bacterium]